MNKDSFNNHTMHVNIYFVCAFVCVGCVNLCVCVCICLGL